MRTEIFNFECSVHRQNALLCILRQKERKEQRLLLKAVKKIDIRLRGNLSIERKTMI